MFFTVQQATSVNGHVIWLNNYHANHRVYGSPKWSYCIITDTGATGRWPVLAEAVLQFSVSFVQFSSLEMGGVLENLCSVISHDEGLKCS